MGIEGHCFNDINATVWSLASLYDQLPEADVIMKWLGCLGVHNRLHIYPMGWVFYLPQHRHRIHSNSILMSNAIDIQLGWSSRRVLRLGIEPATFSGAGQYGVDWCLNNKATVVVQKTGFPNFLHCTSALWNSFYWYFCQICWYNQMIQISFTCRCLLNIMAASKL